MVPDVFGLTLTDAVIEEMIKCVQNGKGLQLSLGEHPVSSQSIIWAFRDVDGRWLVVVAGTSSIHLQLRIHLSRPLAIVDHPQ